MKTRRDVRVRVRACSGLFEPAFFMAEELVGGCFVHIRVPAFFIAIEFNLACHTVLRRYTRTLIIFNLLSDGCGVKIVIRHGHKTCVTNLVVNFLISYYAAS